MYCVYCLQQISSDVNVTDGSQVMLSTVVGIFDLNE